MRHSRLVPLLLVSAALLAPAGVAQDPEDPVAEEDFDELFDAGLDDILGGIDVGAEELDGGEGSVLQAWKGFLRVKPRYYFKDRDQGRHDEQLLVESEFELDFRFAESVDGYFRPRVYFDALDGDLERFEPYEAFVTFAGDGWDLRTGQFVENWGIVDTFNPIDVVNRRDLGSDILDPQRLGEMGARLRLLMNGGDTIGEPTLSFYALPVFRETRFAPEDQRFGFGGGALAFDEFAGFEPSGSERSFLAVRFQSTLDTAPLNADVQLLAARGPERTPTIVAATPALLVPAYYGASTFGAGFRAVPNEDVAGGFLATFTFKAEVVYKDPYSFDNAPMATPDDYVTTVVGVDRSFFDVLEDADELTLTVEYAKENGASDPSSLLRPFRNDLILRGLWQAHDFARTSFEVRALLDLDVDERIVEAIFERQLRSIDEDLRFTLQLQMFDRAPGAGTLFNFFPNNTSLAAGFTLDF